MENYDTIPFESLNDVIPGEPWQPEPAARYNAVNALLRRGFTENAPPPYITANTESIVNLFNISQKTLAIQSPVELLMVYENASKIIDERNPMIYGTLLEHHDCRWGIALENIAPGHAGPVQISGLAVIFNVQKTVNKFVTVIPRPWGGEYEFAEHGRAEVIYADDFKRAVISLGTSSSSGYNGMFAVKDNADGTFTIKGGITDLDSSDWPGRHRIEDTVFTPPDVDRNYIYILLVATFQNGAWKLSYKTTEDENFYIPGKQMYWHLAYYRGFDPDTGLARELTQLWQGGMICFRDRFYLS